MSKHERLVGQLPNRLFDADAELASFSLTLEPNGESDQWGSD